MGLKRALSIFMRCVTVTMSYLAQALSPSLRVCHTRLYEWQIPQRYFTYQFTILIFNGFFTFALWEFPFRLQAPLSISRDVYFYPAFVGILFKETFQVL